jgi:death on curing protein
VSESETPDEPRWLTDTMMLAIHAQQTERYGGAHGMLDENVVRSALARPIQRRAYDDDADLADFAVAYLAGFARSQGFKDGNKRTALACALVSLRLNGQDLHVPPKELYALTMQAANGQADDEVVAAHVRERMTTRTI